MTRTNFVLATIMIMVAAVMGQSTTSNAFPPGCGGIRGCNALNIAEGEAHRRAQFTSWVAHVKHTCTTVPLPLVAIT